MSNAREQQYIKMTQTPVQKLIVSLSVPTILIMLVTSIYNMADTAFVGVLGTSASGAVGVVFGFMAIIQAIGFMFGQGAGSILSRKLGQKDYEGASMVGSTGLFSSIFVGLLILVGGFLFTDQLVYLLGSTKTIAPYAKTYISYILIASPLMIASFVLNTILRYEGKAHLGMFGMMTGSLLNIAGDPIFMFVFHMDIAGAGLSTALSQVIGFCILLYMFLSGKTQTKLSIKRVNPSLEVLGDICGTGFPSLIRQSLASIATMVLNKEAGVYGDAAVAAMSIVSRINMFVFSFALGIAQGFQPISAFNFGAKKYKRVRTAFIYTTIYAEIIILIMSAVVLFFSGNLIGMFRDDPAVIEIGTRALQLQCATLIIIPVTVTTEMMLQSTGYRLQASFLSSLKSGIIFIPVLLVLSSLRGLTGIQEAQPIAYVLNVFPALYMLSWFFKRIPHEDE